MRLQGSQPWGEVLDAGTGSHSLAWLAGLPTRRIVAVTGDDRMKREVEAAVTLRNGVDSVICGNWNDPSMLSGRKFDTVLADYLLGAMDGFAPYFQHRLFERLRPHIGGRLYFVGIEPFPEKDDTPHGQLLIDVAKTRDACILLAGERPYREYPLQWVLTHLKQSGYVIESVASISSTYSAEFVRRQIAVGESKLHKFADPALRQAMRAYTAGLRARVAALRWPFQFQDDYVVSARVAPSPIAHSQSSTSDAPRVERVGDE